MLLVLVSGVCAAYAGESVVPIWYVGAGRIQAGLYGLGSGAGFELAHGGMHWGVHSFEIGGISGGWASASYLNLAYYYSPFRRGLGMGTAEMYLKAKCDLLQFDPGVVLRPTGGVSAGVRANPLVLVPLHVEVGYRTGYAHGSGNEPDTLKGWPYASIGFALGYWHYKRTMPPPVLVGYAQLTGSGAAIRPGDGFDVQLVVENKGKGPAAGLIAQVEADEASAAYLGLEKPVALPRIEPGKVASLSIRARTTLDVPLVDVAVRVVCRDKKGKEFFRSADVELHLAAPGGVADLDEGQPAPSQLVGGATDVETEVPTAAQLDPDAVGVIVGGANYDKIPRVDYAGHDAATMKEYLVKTLGYVEKNIIDLKNPTKADLEMVFGISGNAQGQLWNYVRKGESDVFVYYTGHGAPDLKTKEAYLVPTDAQPSYIDLQGYPLSTFYENLTQIPAKSVTVVLDACFSGAYDKGLIVQQASPLVPGVPEELGALPNGVIMASASGDQVSSWYADKKHSLFTYWFLKGLQGAADKNGDKTITTGEMKTYLSDNVPYWAQRLHNRIQTPTFAGDESRVIARFK
jgi:hypothetical protein